MAKPAISDAETAAFEATAPGKLGSADAATEVSAAGCE
jgi:hypothetical protein